MPKQSTIDSVPGSDDFEGRLRTLAARGFRVALSAATEDYGQHKGEVRFSIDLTKGSSYGGAGMSARGTGHDLDEATRSALRAAEAFLADPEPPAAIDGALTALGPARLPGPALQAAE